MPDDGLHLHAEELTGLAYVLDVVAHVEGDQLRLVAGSCVAGDWAYVDFLG